MDCKFKEFVDEIDFWNVCLIEYKIMFFEFYWWNFFFVFFNYLWGILMFCLVKYWVLLLWLLDYFVFIDKERIVWVIFFGGFVVC